MAPPYVEYLKYNQKLIVSQSQAPELCAQLGIMFLLVHWDRPFAHGLPHIWVAQKIVEALPVTTEHPVSEIYSEINSEPITGDRTLRTSGNHVPMRILGQSILAWATPYLCAKFCLLWLFGTMGHRVAEILSEINCEPITGGRTLRTSGNHVFIRTLRQTDIWRMGYCVFESRNNWRRFAWHHRTSSTWNIIRN